MYFCAVQHETFMQRCFWLAQKGLGYTAPNPLVGAVIVHNGKIIGEGYHAAYGQCHAEVAAIVQCKQPELLRHATLYVSLEPCSHFGKTPPCADLIIEKQIPHVVICNTDPFPEVAGRGIKKLEEAGIKVETGIAEKDGLWLNRRFFTFHTKKRPYIILKWAQSADRFIDGNQPSPIKITSHATDQIVHQWRAEEAGILVGYNTALKDNPGLTVRHVDGKNPLRIVIDPTLSLPDNLILFSDGNATLVLNQKKSEQRNNIAYTQSETNQISAILQSLYKANVQSVIIEGGSKTLQRFIDTGTWDEARVITGDISIGKGTLAPILTGGTLIHTQHSGNDTIYFYTAHTT